MVAKSRQRGGKTAAHKLIKVSGGSQYFFHQSAIYGEGIEMLREGHSVEFELGPDGPKGPRAESVKRTST